MITVFYFKSLPQGRLVCCTYKSGDGGNRGTMDGQRSLYQYSNMTTIETESLSNSTYLAASIAFFRVGKVVYFSYQNDVLSLPTGQTTIGNTPTSMVPVQGYILMNSTSADIQITISSTVTVYNYSGSAVTNAKSCRFCGSYIAKN